MDTSKAISNKEMASVLFNIATLLKDDPEANPYRIAAYERAGRAMMGLRKEAGEILAGKPQITFRRRQHIGKKLQAKIGEMAQTGDLAQFEEMLATALPPIGEIVRTVPGIGPAFAERAHRALGVGNREELVRAARDGRLRNVRGFGERRTARIAAIPLSSDARQLTLFDV